MAVTQVTYNTHDVQLLLEPVDCRMTQLVFSSVAHCIASADKLEVMAGESSVSCLLLAKASDWPCNRCSLLVWIFIRLERPSLSKFNMVDSFAKTTRKSRLIEHNEIRN